MNRSDKSYSQQQKFIL